MLRYSLESELIKTFTVFAVMLKNNGRYFIGYVAFVFKNIKKRAKLVVSLLRNM